MLWRPHHRLCPSPSLPVPLKPDFTITPLAGFSAHSAPPSRETWVSSPLTQVIATSSLFDFQNMSPDNLHHDHLSRPHAHPPGSLQQPPCLPGRGLHPGASKPSGPALVTPHISLCVQPGGPPPVPGPFQHPPTSRAFAPAMPICPVLVSSFGSQLLSPPPCGLSWPVL